MRKLILTTAAITICFFVSLTFLRKEISENTIRRFDATPIKITNEENGEDEDDGILDAQKMEFELTKDVSLGYVPRFRLVNAFKNLMKNRYLNTPANVSALTWTERGPNADVVGPTDGNTRAGNGTASGRIRAIWIDLADPTYHTVWVGGIDGGIWKTTNISASPATWSPVNDLLSNLAVSSICQDPLGTKDTMYFGTGEKTFNADAVRGGGIFKSTDHGVTWNLLPSTTSFYNVSKIICDTLGNVYVSTIGNGKGIQRSTDGGNTWTNITPSGLNANVTDMKLSRNGRLHIVCGYNGGANAGYRFTDNAATVTASGWTAPITAFPNVQYNTELAVGGDSVLYALISNSSYQTPQIYKSTDGGDNWSGTATSPPAASGTNDLSSGQAWYCMAIAMDPSNDSNVVAGGLNCYRTTNGGSTWTQLSTWVGSSLSYIHADQQTAVWAGNEVLVGSDGGIFYSSDGGATFSDRNKGLRIRQYYSCAIHPTSTNYFLAGAQDNGVSQFTNAGLGSITEVTGGDGAFVHIDQDQPQYQFGSYVYNQYRRSTDGGNTWSSVNYSNSVGSFINPTDYDNVSNKMYCGGNSNQYIRWENPQTGNTFNPITIAAFSGSVRSVTVSPYTPNRVFFGSSSGKVVQVDAANSASPAATNIAGSGMPGSSVSCVALGTNDSNLLATFSNYGAAHVWVTTTKGGSSGWTNITGNLPDIPVRWAMFYPEDNTKALVATEMGVYETSGINGSSTVWTRDASFPIVRTDMLQYRKSDGTVAAATHGRGLWTADIPVTIPYIRFAENYGEQTETTAATTGCRNYKDYTVNMTIDAAPVGDATVTLNVAGGGTATQGVDYDFTTNGNFASPSNILTFPNGSTTSQPITIRVYDDAEIENSESFTLTDAVSGSTNAQAAPSSTSYTFTIDDNDVAPNPSGPTNNYTIGSQSYYLTSGSESAPFNAVMPSMRTQMLYKASELTAAGITAGIINSVAFYITKQSTRAYQNLEIKMAQTTQSALVPSGTIAPVTTSTVKTLSSYSTVSGWNTFTLDVPFHWDGTSNIVIEICYDNGIGAPGDLFDETVGYSDGSSASTGNMIWQDSINCSGTFTQADANDFGQGIKPQLQLNVTANGNLIALSGSKTENISDTGTYYFYDSTYILNTLNSASANLGCVSAVISDTGIVWQSFFGGMRSKKVFDITPTTNSGASYTVGLYFDSTELGGRNPATLQIAKTDATNVSLADGSNTIIGTTSYIVYGSGYLFTAPFTGFSYYFLVDASVVLPVTLLSFDGNAGNNNILLRWKTSSEHNSKYFDIEKSTDGINFYSLGLTQAAGNSAVTLNYNYTDNQPVALNYYRLKLIDVDNKFIYSSTILIKDESVSQRVWIDENPFHNNIIVHLARLPQQEVRTELSLINGQRIFTKVFSNTTFINMDVSNLNLSKGIYILRALVDNKMYTYKLIKK